MLPENAELIKRLPAQSEEMFVVPLGGFFVQSVYSLVYYIIKSDMPDVKNLLLRHSEGTIPKIRT